MAQMMEYVEYLAKEIGARPAGTEEEQQAALYITEQIQKESGFAANIEEFSSSSNVEGGQAILAMVAIVATVLAMLFPILAIPAFVFAVAAAAVFVLEAYDKPIVSRFLSRGASQNVVAKYQPSAEGAAGPRASSRKLVLVAHYDTGRVTPPLVERMNSFGVSFDLICVVALALTAFLQLLRIFVAPGGGMGLIVLNVLSVLALIVCALPVARALLIRSAPYNEGANNNATGTAVLIDVARRIARGSVSEADLAEHPDDDIFIHGEQAAREANLVPEGADIRYEAEQLVPPAGLGDYDEEERLLSAKAAIAAFTGKPVDRKIHGSVASNLVNSRVQDDGYEPAAAHQDGERAGERAGQGAGSAMAPAAPAGVASVSGEPAPVTATGASEDAEGFQNAPSWFVAAQQNARKSDNYDPTLPASVHRSKYTEALENADRIRAEQEQARLEAEQRAREAEERAREAEMRAAVEAEERAARERIAAEERAFADAPAVSIPGDPSATVAHTPINEGMVDGVATSAPGAPVLPDAQAPFGADPASAAYPATAPATAPAPDLEFAAAPAGEPERRAGISLPEIGVDQIPTTTSPSRSGLLRKLRTNVPSLSGLLDPVGDAYAPPVPSAPEAAPVEAIGTPRSRSARQLASMSLPSVYDEPGAEGDSLAGAHASSPQFASPSQDAAPAQPSQSASAQALPSIDQQFAGAQPAAQPQEASDDAWTSGVSLPPVSMPRIRSGASSAVDYDMEVPLSQDSLRGDFGDDLQDNFEDMEADEAYNELELAEVPRSRADGLLSRLRRNKGESLSDSPQEWLDVDDDFDALSAGRARGSWESFRDDQYFDDEEGFDDFGTGDPDGGSRRRRLWNGGAASARQSLGHVNMRSGETSDADKPVDAALLDPKISGVITEQVEQIYHFRNPQFQTEIWFVAMGSDGMGHDGTRAFIEEHHDELRGAMIIEIESLGAGSLAVASEEGALRKMSASSRVKRFVRGAVSATGISPNSVSLAGYDSVASTVQKAGHQAMHLFGEENGRIALKGSADDVLENVDEMLLEENSNFVFELLKG